MTDQAAQSMNPQGTSYVDDYAPPSSGAAMSQPNPVMSTPQTPAMPSPATTPGVTSTPAAESGTSPVSQALEDQNIFFLLGADNATEQEKEAFLDELQQVIWEDFVDNDVKLLITDEELTQLKGLMEANKSKSDLDQQEAIVVFLEKLIPDLEEIMLEKALELKEDMVKERIASMKESAAGDTAKLQRLTEAEAMIADDQWQAAAKALNSI